MTSACPAATPGTARLDVAEIFRRFGPSWQASHALTPWQGRVLRHIIDCRTPALGGHRDTCDHCGQTWCSYNSCRDRHCPTCQGLQQLRWIARRTERLVPTHHFHVVFTLPSELRPVALANPRRVYDLLFAAAKETLLELARDRWEATPGITAVLHTWTRQMALHPHLHCVVTGGGLTDDGAWVSSRPRFMFPIRVMGALFRGKFLAGLARLHARGDLRLVGTSASLAQPSAFADYKDALYRKRWVVYAKRPFGGPEQVLRYLGRYTHRVAISSSRLVSLSDQSVVFRTHGPRTCRLTPDEFLRRFVLHILPKRFWKIRHYGLFASSSVGLKLRIAQDIATHLNRALRRAHPEQPTTPIQASASTLNDRTCPVCKIGHLVRSTLPPARGPP